jgi:hypothetical protein
MSKIICSLEQWDSIIDYYRPNGSSKSWYIKELKKMQRPLMWGDWNILTEQNEMFDVGVFKSIVTPHYSRDIEYVPYEEIGDSKHLYIINVYNGHYFHDNFNIGFSTISEKYLNDIKNGKSKIVMFFIYEGYSGSLGNNDLDVIEKWRKDAELPTDSIYYVSGNLLCEQLVKNKNLGYQARALHNFEPWNKYYENNVIDYKPIDNKYLFLSYNRQYRAYRIGFIIDLLEQAVFDKGLISLNRYDYVFPPNAKEEHINFILNNAPFVIDSKHDLNYNLAINITTEDYERTFMSVISETLVDTDTLFFSEKIWKPIMVGHPFMLLGNKDSLKYLKGLGYKTFDKWINESYDNEPNSRLRSLMISQELKRLSEKPLEELKQIREDMKEICQHNQDHYKILYNQNYDNGDVSKKITNILKEVWDSIKIWNSINE